ncbi:MAG: sulfurtransferase [Lachnospirales bacterium]
MKFRKTIVCTLLGLVLVSCVSTNDVTDTNNPQDDVSDNTSTNVDNKNDMDNESMQHDAGDIDFKVITEEELKNSNHIIIDARPSFAYSGWETSENKFGGHIMGATDFSSDLFSATYDDNNNLEGLSREELLQRYITEKGIDENSSVVIYDENGEDSLIVANYLVSKGVTDISLFDLNKWTGELEEYDDYELYVPPIVLKDLIDGKEVDEIEDVEDLVVLEVSWGTVEESGYVNGHIPTSIHVNSDDFDDENNLYMLESDEVLFDLAKSQGITTDSTVVVTGDPIFSCRYAVILEYLGVDDVYVMSGGVNGWTDAGYEMETTQNDGSNVTDFGTSAPLQPDLIDTVEEAKQLKDSPNFTLVDVRTEEEYNAETSGYSYFDTAGRIEGAFYGHAGINDPSSMMYYRNLNGYMRNGYEILDMLQSEGIDINSHLSFYCGGGYRASEAVWDMKVMGYDDVSLFADGWMGWILAGNDYVTE